MDQKDEKDSTLVDRSERITNTVWVASKSAKPSQIEAIQNHCDLEGWRSRLTSE